MCKLLFIGLTILLLTACEQENNSFSGYVDTDLVYLSADFGGRLADLAVLRGQQVQNNQLLFKLEQTSELYNVQMSKLSKKICLRNANKFYPNSSTIKSIIGVSWKCKNKMQPAKMISMQPEEI